MGVRVVVSKSFTINPGSEAYQVVYTVSPGSRLRLKKVRVFFPPGALSELLVKLLQGWTSLAPTEGFFSGDGVELVYDVEAEYGSMSRIMAYLKNTSTTGARTCTITLEGEEG